MAPQGTEARVWKRGRKVIDKSKPYRNVPKARQFEVEKNVRIETNNRYTGTQVRQIVDVYRKRVRENARLLREMKIRHAGTVARKDKMIVKYKKKAGLNSLMLSGVRSARKRVMANMRRRMDALKEELKQAKKKQVAEIRKREREKLKHYYKVPVRKTELENYDTVSLVRMQIKIRLIAERTKMSPTEAVCIIWIASYKPGFATNKRWALDTEMPQYVLTNGTKRLKEHGLVIVDKSSRPYSLNLTARGQAFSESIIKFVKSEKRNAERRSREYIRSGISAAKATSGLQDGESQVQ